VCDPAFGLERCKSRQRFREGGFFYGFSRWVGDNGFLVSALARSAQAG
jgi:hypothetical protein